MLAFSVIVLVASLAVLVRPAAAHLAALDAAWATTVPSIDGVIDPGEWVDAGMANLTAIPGNGLPSYLYAKNDDSFLWLAYDGVGDTTEDPGDAASVAFDTWHDGLGSDGFDDQFYLAASSMNGSAHYVYDSNFRIVLHDAPFDEGLPGHAGLRGAVGFAASDRSAVSHRAYELQIPLVLINGRAGDTIGLFGGSRPVPGIVDATGFAYSTWPEFVSGPADFPEYGDLNLADAPASVGAAVTPSSLSSLASAGTSAWYNLTVRNTGTAGSDVLDVEAFSTWPVALYDALGSPLADTDGDTIPDTDSLPSGSSVGIGVQVSVPANMSGCDLAYVSATSSVDTGVWDWSNLTTCTGSASFLPPFMDSGVDVDGDLLFEFLSVTALVDLANGGTFEVVARLQNLSGNLTISEEYTFIGPTPGIQNATVLFSGYAIALAGVDGPYRVDLQVRDASYFLHDTDVHVTAAYLASDFDSTPSSDALFAPPHSDAGADTDVPPNGLYDALVVEVNVAVYEAGSYYVVGYLSTSTGSFLGAATGDYSGPRGLVSVNLSFSGRSIAERGEDGPYTVSLDLGDSFMFLLLDRGTHITQAYAASDFDGPPFLFAPPHSDTAVDTDSPGDGLYDWLLVRARLTVNESGTYSFIVFLRGTFAPFDFATLSADLSPGTREVEFRFAGNRIADAGEDGPYEVELWGQKDGDPTSSDYDVHMTSAYLAADFTPTRGRFAPPHADVGIDVSSPADGLVDVIRIDAAVNASEADTFEVQLAIVGWGYRVLAFASGQASLPVGLGTVPVSIDASPFVAAGFDGLYTVSLLLLDHHGLPQDGGLHTTAAYDASRFQPEDVTAPVATASVTGNYWWNALPLTVAFSASDPSPSDGLASVTLWYRRSAQNATWGPWTAYGSQLVGGSSASGTFSFAAPEGEGHYEFAAQARDAAGRAEAPPAAAEARAALFLPAGLELDLAASAVAGLPSRGTLQIVNATGSPAVLGSARTVSLATDSPSGSFRAAGGTTAITQVVIPAGSSSVSFDYVDTRAGTARLEASAATWSGSADLPVEPGSAAEIVLDADASSVAPGAVVRVAAHVADVYGNVIGDASIAWSISGPGTLSSALGSSIEVTATGSGRIVVTALSGGYTASATIDVTGGVTDLAVGLGGGAAVGIAGGVAAGWYLWRLRGRRKPPEPPAGET